MCPNAVHRRLAAPQPSKMAQCPIVTKRPDGADRMNGTATNISNADTGLAARLKQGISVAIFSHHVGSHPSETTRYCSPIPMLSML